jgi:WD40 repeat protein
MVARHHKAPIVALKYDGLKNIISADSMGSILITDLNGTLLNELKHDKLVEPISSLILVGALAITSTSNGKVMFWNRFNNECEAAVKCHNAAVNSIDYFDGRFYTAGS